MARAGPNQIARLLEDLPPPRAPALRRDAADAMTGEVTYDNRRPKRRRRKGRETESGARTRTQGRRHGCHRGRRRDGSRRPRRPLFPRSSTSLRRRTTRRGPTTNRHQQSMGPAFGSLGGPAECRASPPCLSALGLLRLRLPFVSHFTARVRSGRLRPVQLREPALPASSSRYIRRTPSTELAEPDR